MITTQVVVSVSPETKLLVAYQKLVEIMTVLDPGKRGDKIRARFDELRSDAERLGQATAALDILSERLIESVYFLADMITVELASTTMIADAVKEADEPTSEANLLQPQHQKEQTPGPR